MYDVQGWVDYVPPRVQASLVFPEHGIIGGPTLASILLNLPGEEMQICTHLLHDVGESQPPPPGRMQRLTPMWGMPFFPLFLCPWLRERV